MRNIQIIAALLLCFGLSSLGTADTLNMPSDGANSTQSTPKRGMTKQQVERNFGSPDSKHGPTGTPPIYFWEYPGFTVYFESNYVLHSVLKYRQKP